MQIEHHRLAVEDELLDPQLQRGLDDPWVSLGVVQAACGLEPHAIVLPDHHHPVAIVLDLVEPVGAGWDGKALGRNTKFKRLKHAAQICAPRLQC